MDLRMKKTLAAIRNAFIELRSHKPLEKITVKELTEKAEISKATFYLHYQDVYDLSSSIQEEVIDEVFSNIENPETILSDTEGFTRTLFYATSASKALVDIVFADNQALVLPEKIEEKIKKSIFAIHPEFKDDIRLNISITFRVQGAYNVYRKYSGIYEPGEIINNLCMICN